MVHIKKVEIYGFKSFGFKNTTIQFGKGLSVVTGPNGSGKSNVLDAIMFAIGENSPKALRVDKFQSLFHDSQNDSHRLTRVSLAFDNADRGIPVNSDSVTVTREMEGQTGDSQYYLNGKKVSKSNIVELLEVVIPSPSKLNIVQQGMITRISELNSDERRKIIEDIVGLSYFDDKKAEAIKQLEESDRRLEVALAKMGEIRKRIDELEAERNDQLRYEQLESELKRLEAISTLNKKEKITSTLESQNKLLSSKTLAASNLFNQMEEIRTEIDGLESQKSAFIKKVDSDNKSKAQIAGNIARIVYEAERSKAMLKESEHRILEIEKRINSINQERQHIAEKTDKLNSNVHECEQSVAASADKRIALKSELSEINSQIDLLTSKKNKYSAAKNELGHRHIRLSAIQYSIRISIARLEEKIQINKDRMLANKSRASAHSDEIDKLTAEVSEVNRSLEVERTEMETKTRLIESIGNSQIKLESELSSSGSLVRKAEPLASAYEIQQEIVEKGNNEDVALADLMKDPGRFGIKGIAHNVIRCDKKYERAVYAAAFGWLKAIIVHDSKSMVSILKYAKSTKLPRLKMIPLDILKYAGSASGPTRDANIIGNLADYVYSDYNNLSAFLFGNTFVAKTPSTAYLLAKDGYRCVSLDGVLFEPSGIGVSVDFGSQISYLTKAILLTDSVTSLRSLITTMKILIEKKASEFKDNTIKLNEAETGQAKTQTKIMGLQVQSLTLDRSKIRTQKILDQLVLDNEAMRSDIDLWTSMLRRYEKQMSILTVILDTLSSRIQEIDDPFAANEAAHFFNRKNQILRSIEKIDIELGQFRTSLLMFNNQIQINAENLRAIEEDDKRLKSELEERNNQLSSLATKLGSIESELKIFRDEEQQLIHSSGNSYSVLQEYEQKIKQLREMDKKMSKEYNTLDRETAVLKRDITDISSEQSRLNSKLVSLGYKEKDLLDPFEVEYIIAQLAAELEATKSRINLRAHESYVQVIDGYRGISSRQNQLENERNSIVIFIEGVINEKYNVFMDAFRRVDGDIRKTFSEVTGGQAWLETENPEDIFSSGIMLMVQFPGKPGRESTSLSGGEKTIAASIFLLGLQSLKPSAFYLMDEIDAHLDAENNDRLSAILLARSKDNQIIVVTLKDTTVAKANMIYGVYPKDGISHIVRYSHPNKEAIVEVKSNSNAQQPL